MAKREKLAYQQNYSVSNEDNIEDNHVKIFAKTLGGLITKWTVVSVLFLVAIFFFFDVDTMKLLLYTSYANTIILILFIASSAFAGNTAVQIPMLYVSGTGAIEDMSEAKRRANSFMLPFAIMIHALIFYLLSWLFQTN